MAARKPKEGDESSVKLATVFAGSGGLPPMIMVGMLLIVTFTVSVGYGWRRWGKTVVARPIYRLSEESLQISPPPGWIRTDVRSEVVRDGALNDLTIFDKDATIRVYQAFELHPWIAKVQRVSKQPPATLVVDVEYRRPVAWVEVPGAKPTDEGGVIPIDGAGFVLPSRDFEKKHLKDYIRISVRDVKPYGLAGTAWGDPRVHGAAKIAALLVSGWRELKLYRIQLVTDPELAGTQSNPLYEIETSGHGHIIWGNAPGTETADEPSAVVKVNRLVQAAETLGSLEQVSGMTIDLRDPNTLPSSRTAGRGLISPFKAH